MQQPELGFLCQFRSKRIEVEAKADAFEDVALIGKLSADASEVAFRFGRDGKPNAAPLIRLRIAQLQKCLGDDGFETAA